MGRFNLPLAISNSVARNHNDLYIIHVQSDVVTGTSEQTNILVNGLFLNAETRFDSKEFRLCCEKKEINAKVCFNKKNGDKDKDEYFEQLLCNEHIKLKEQMRG